MENNAVKIYQQVLSGLVIGAVASGVILSVPTKKPVAQSAPKTILATRVDSTTPATTPSPTAPSSTASNNPSASSSAPSTATPTPVTVVSYKQTPDGTSTNCTLTYSDGTNYTWAWQTVDPQGAWVQNAPDYIGHWQATTTTNDVCDQSVVGTVKR